MATVVHVPMSEAAPVIQRLLQAAQELGYPPSVVATSTDGVFGFSLVVPEDVHLRANGVTQADINAVDAEPEPEPAPKKKGGRPRKAAAEPVVEEQE